MRDFHSIRSKLTHLGPRNRDTARSKTGNQAASNARMLNNISEAARRRLLETKTGRIAANILDAAPTDSLANQLIEELLVEDDVRAARSAPFLKRQANEGELILGEDLADRTPHRLSTRDLTNTLLAGVPGCGKSTFIGHIAPQLALQKIKVLIADLEKDGFRSRVPFFERYGLSLEVVDGRTFPFNPLEVPKGTDPFQFLEHCALTMGTALDAGEPSLRILRGAIYQQFKARGIFEGSRNFPVLAEVRQSVVEQPTRNRLALEATLARLDAVLLNSPGLHYRIGASTERISKNNVVLECSGMSLDARNLLIGGIYGKEFFRRKQLGRVNSAIDWALFLDDSQRICANPDGLVAQTINVVRSTGIVLNLSVQSPKLVAPAILANTQAKLCGMLGSAEDSYFMARSMGLLSREQSQWIATNLQRGQFLVQLAHGWREPFLLEVAPGMLEKYLPPPPPIPPRARITDESHKGESPEHSLFAAELVEAAEYRDYVPPEWKRSSVRESRTTPSESLSANEREFMELVIRIPGQPCSTYNRGLSFGQKVAIRVRKELVEKGLLYEEQVRTKTFGRAAKLITPSEAGERLLAQAVKNAEKPQ